MQVNARERWVFLRLPRIRLHPHLLNPHLLGVPSCSKPGRLQFLCGSALLHFLAPFCALLRLFALFCELALRSLRSFACFVRLQPWLEQPRLGTAEFAALQRTGLGSIMNSDSFSGKKIEITIDRQPAWGLLTGSRAICESAQCPMWG